MDDTDDRCLAGNGDAIGDDGGVVDDADEDRRQVGSGDSKVDDGGVG